MIPDDVVERVRTAADIVQVIGEYVPLRRVGTDFRGACPFHGGKNPNFSVSARRGQYHCFVCHESGDVIAFLRKRLALDFTSAVKLLGDKVGIDVVDTPTRAHAPDPNEPNWEVLAHAAAWFHTQLCEADVAGDARRYLEARGLDEAAWVRFALGFAPRDGQLLLRHLATLGFDQERARDAGLLVVREEEGTSRPRFRGRVMFPIVDELGRHVAFGGRAMGDDTPKYLNSAESGVFQKRRVLYGMHTARQAARRAARLLVVEGYLDAIRVALAGVEEVVAPLGTALTEEQAALVTRYAPEVFLLYDSDEAGLKATFRSGLELLRHGARVRVVSLPPGEDPDTFVRAHGAAGLEALLHEAVDVFDRQVDLLARKGWFSDLHHRRRAVDKLLPTIRATRDPITRDLYVARLAEAASLDRSTVLQEAEAPTPPPGRALARRPVDAPQGAPPEHDAPPPDEQPAPLARKRPWVPKGEWRGRGRSSGPEWLATDAPPRAPRSDDPLERELVRVMLRDRGWVERIAERHGPDVFRDERYRGLFRALLAHEPTTELAVVLEALAPELVALAEGLLAQAEAPADVQWNLRQLDRRALEADMALLQERITAAEGEEMRRLMREKERLARERQALLHQPGKGRSPGA
jgi:DNA primase